MSASDIRSLDGAFSACVRFVYGLGRYDYDSTRDYTDELLKFGLYGLGLLVDSVI